jgi:hypothetical protein
MKKFTLLAALAALSAHAAAPPSQPQPQPERVRGTIQAFDGQTLTLATAEHGVVKIAVGEGTGINGLEKKTVDDIHDNTFIGTTAIGRQPKCISFRRRCVVPARATMPGISPTAR